MVTLRIAVEKISSQNPRTKPTIMAISTKIHYSPGHGYISHPGQKENHRLKSAFKKGICDLFLKGNPILLLVTQLFFWVKSQLPLHSKLLGSMYGIFTYIYHKKINHSCGFSYTNHPMDPMGSRYTLSR